MRTARRATAALAATIFLALLAAPSAFASASFTAIPNPQIAGQAISFSGSAKSSCDGAWFAQCDADTYSWDFGDGTTASTKNVSHTYMKPGSYKVTMSGCYCHYVSNWQTTSQTVTILPPDKSRSVTLTTPLSGMEQSETIPGDPDGTGFATLTFYPDADQFCYNVTYANINSFPTIVGHIHHAPRGQYQFVPVVQMEDNDGVSPAWGCRPIDPVQMADVLAHPIQYYVQFHNTEFPEGVIRGQLGD